MHRSSEDILVTGGDAGGLAQAWVRRLGSGFDAVAVQRLLDLDPAEPEALMRSLLSLFSDSLSAQSKALQAALDAGELDGIRRAAHAVRSPAMSLGALDFAQACQVVEQQALDLLRDASGPRHACLNGAAAVLASMNALQGQLQLALAGSPVLELPGHGRD